MKLPSYLALVALLALVSTTLIGCGGGAKAASQPSSVAVGDLSAATTTVDLGPVAPGATASKDFVITNTGSASVTVSQINLSAPFGMSNMSLPATVTAGQSAHITLTFTPTGTSNVTSLMTILHNGKSSPSKITLNGQVTVAPPVVAVSVTPSAASVVAGGSIQLSATVTGSTNTAVTWSVVSGGGSFSGTGLYHAPAGTGTAIVRATSIADSTKSATATLTLTAASTTLLSASPTTLAFGNVATGGSSNLTSTITNTGTSSVTLQSWSIPGAPYSVSGIAFPATLGPGATRVVSVTFAPSSIGSQAGAISVVSTATNSPTSISLTGAGVAPAAGTLTVAPTNVDFGTATVGSTVDQTVTATAAGASVTVSQANITGAAFRVTSPALPVTIAAGQSTNFTLQFAPTASGTANGTLSLVSNASNSPASAALSGTGASVQTSSGGPVIFFSDLTWGPKTGWEGSTTKGAAVTIWGKNFGATRGTNFVTVNGAQLTAAGDYAEWDAIGPARGLERVTFWLNNTAQDGAGNITVSVNGVTSNPVPFNVTTGTIYFIAPNGSNTNDGKFSTPQSGTNGPFKDIFKFNPGADGFHSAATANPSGDGQYIVYVRAGTYTAQDVDEAMVALRGPYGGPAKQKALIGYPAETPIIDTALAHRGIIWTADYSPYGKDDYFTFAKLEGMNGTEAVSVLGDNCRVIGNNWHDFLDDAWTGVVFVGGSKNTQVLGNRFDHNGFDSFKHNVYIKTQPSFPGADISTLNTNVGWNEFSNAVSSDVHGGVIFISKSSDSGSFITDGTLIHDNYFHDGVQEFVYSGDNTPLGGTTTIYNNVMKGGTSPNGGLALYPGSNTINLYNNVFYQIGNISQAMVQGTGAAQIHFKNNIWVTQAAQPFFALETFQGATANFDHDLFFGAGNFTLPSGPGMTLVSPLTGDPQFVNAAAADFHLQATSPAVNAGTNSVNVVVKQDYDGKSRPQGAAFDIGPFER